MSGVGLSGVCVSELTFTTPAPFYAARAAEVTVIGLDNVPSFYISRRQQRGGIVTVSCLDRLAFSDINFPAEKLDDSVGDDVPAGTVLDLISMEMGKTPPSYGDVPDWLTAIPKNSLENASCVDVLQKISEACCGVWYLTESGGLQFLKFGELSGGAYVSQHTAVDVGASLEYKALICTDGDGSTMVRGSGAAYETVQINSELINTAGCNEIFERLQAAENSVWSCEKFCTVGNIIPNVGYKFEFKGGGKYVASSVECAVTPSGIYCTASGGNDGGDEITTRGSLTRTVENRVEYGKKSKNIINTRYQGILIVDDKEVK